jgi:hypothetical protein
VAEIDKLYDKAEFAPFHKTGRDGLVDEKQYKCDVMIRKPQLPEDKPRPITYRSPDGCALATPPQSPFSIRSAIGNDELR